MAPACESIKITEWIAILVALCALGITLWQGCVAREQANIARKHNKMSVMPYLVHNMRWDTAPDGLTATFELRNVGAGLAIFTDRYFTIDGQRFEPKNSAKTVEEFIATLVPTSVEYRLVKSEFFGPIARMPPGSTFTVAKLLFPGNPANRREVIEAYTGKGNLIINYKSMYDEADVYNAKT